MVTKRAVGDLVDARLAGGGREELVVFGPYEEQRHGEAAQFGVGEDVLGAGRATHEEAPQQRSVRRGLARQPQREQVQVDDVVRQRPRRVGADRCPQAHAADEPGQGQPRHPGRDAAEDRRGEHAHREVAARAGDRDRRLADDHGPSDTRRPVEREPQREHSAERVAHERDLVDAEPVEHAGDDVDGLLPDRSALPEVGRRQAVAREIDEQKPVPGQTAGERCHPDAGCRDAVDEQHRVAGARLEDTDPHGRRRDVDPTFLHVESIRRGDALLGRPEPCLDPHRRG